MALQEHFLRLTDLNPHQPQIGRDAMKESMPMPPKTNSEPEATGVSTQKRPLVGDSREDRRPRARSGSSPSLQFDTQTRPSFWPRSMIWSRPGRVPGKLLEGLPGPRGGLGGPPGGARSKAVCQRWGEKRCCIRSAKRKLKSNGAVRDFVGPLR